MFKIATPMLADLKVAIRRDPPSESQYGRQTIVYTQKLHTRNMHTVLIHKYILQSTCIS